jgi:hypothetical protein
VPSAQGISRGPTDAAAEEFFTLFSKASSNVESAAILMEFAALPHESCRGSLAAVRLAELSF